jgi:hypothetical protein
VDDLRPDRPRFSRDEQAGAVWLSHTVIPIAVTVITVLGFGIIPLGFLIPELVIWLVFAVLAPVSEAPAELLLRLVRKGDFSADVEILRIRALPAAFAAAFALQFVALTPLLADTGGPIRSPFAAFVVVYAVFASLLTSQLWSLGVTLVGPTIYYAVMVAVYGFGNEHRLPTEAVYLAVTLVIIWLAVWLAFLSRMSTWRLQTALRAEADRETLRAAVADQVWSRPLVHTRSLPASRPAAHAALAEYAREHPELALHLTANGRALEWVESERMGRARRVKAAFAPNDAAELLAGILGLTDIRTIADGAADYVIAGRLASDPILPGELLLRAVDRSARRSLLEETGVIARSSASDATVAILIVPDATAWLSRATTWTEQRTLTTTIVVLDATNLLHIAGAREPLRALMGALRAQADLSKADPFVVQGPTPSEMFYGRTEEEARVSFLLRDSSAALLGGRRTGKTSLLQHIERNLIADGWLVLYADLQAVRSWAEFADVVSMHWDIDVPTQFAPTHVDKAVKELRKRHGADRVVIMFDEVDHFLRWDQDHDGDAVPEAFFRGCRAMSQEGRAQFILAGERVISERLWSPDSPHWNFCQPIRVRQLARKDAERLLASPLEHLDIELVDRAEFLDHIWNRTSGHPQIVQHLGTELIKLVNNRDPDHRMQLTVADLQQITETAEFRIHYIITYRGQATPFESTVCNLAAAGASTAKRLANELASRDLPHDTSAVTSALRMLDLYGIVDIRDDELRFRAEWMPEALRSNGELVTIDHSLAQHG